MLRAGGIAIFDCQKLFTYSTSNVGVVNFIYIPYELYNKNILKLIIEGDKIIYSELIFLIIKKINNVQFDEILRNRILSLAYALPVIIEPPELSVKKPLIHHIIKVIKENALDPNFSLSKAALLSYCSKRRFSNCLLENGFSFSRLVNEIRINKFAEQLLINKNTRIDILSFNCGFKSASYASKKFKCIKGMTPKEYRFS
nr:AraC family transcriptional regulator [Aliivibrio fischeri]